MLSVPVVACGGGGEEEVRTDKGVLAVAFGLGQEAPGVSVYIGDPAEEPFVVGPGTYYVEAVDGDGLVIGLRDVSAGADGIIDLPESVRDAGGQEDAVSAGQLKTIAGFISDAELAELTALEVISGGFQAELFESSVELDAAQFARLFELYSEIAGQQDAVLAAVDAVEARAEVSASVPQVSVRPAPVFGVFDSIKDQLLGLFTYAGDAGERAREDIIRVAENMSPSEREEAFDAIRPDFRGGANNFDDFVDRLRSGDLDNEAAQIRNDLWQDPGFYGSAQEVCDCGRPELTTAHQEGAELVQRGAELNAQVIKTVLGAQFPDITKGFDLADKADEWAEYINDIYTDPLGTLEGQGRDAIQEKIKDKIKESLGECCPELAEDLADQIAGEIAEQAVETIPEIAPMVTGGESTPEGTQPTAAPTEPPEATPTTAAATSTTVPATATVVIPPTHTAVPPTHTPEPPTSTAVPPTSTLVPPTKTSVPPTATRTSAPTNTPVPPTKTPVPPTLTPVPPSPVPTVGPVFYESLYFPGDRAAIGTSLTYQVGVLYQFCFSGVAYVIENGVKVSKQAYQLPMSVAGVAVGPSNCVTVEGTGGPITITCGHGTPASPPGGYSITVYQLGFAP